MVHVESTALLTDHYELTMVQAALAAGSFVVYTQDWHPESTPHFAKDGGIWPVHCVRDTWGSEAHPDLVVEGQVIDRFVTPASADPSVHEA